MNTSSQDFSQRKVPMPEFIAGLFAVMGVGMLIVLIFNVLGAESIRQAQAAGDTGQMILEFLYRFGIIAPLLMLGAGIAFLNISRKLIAKDLITSNWATQILFWMMIFSVVGLVILILNWISASDPESTLDVSAYPYLLVVVIILAVVLYYSWRWLDKNRLEYYVGEETLSSRQAVLAWNLLLPTVIVLILIAARPLERTFIASLTDQVFAGSSEDVTQFVGFQNYVRLLGFRFDMMDCERDDAGACVVGTDGELDYLSPRDVLGEDYRDLRFRSVREYTFGEKQLVLSVRDRDFFSAVENTMFFTFVTVIAELILGMIIALTVNSKFRGRGIMRAAMLVPWAVPTVISARLWEVMLIDNRAGVINDMLYHLGIGAGNTAWLANHNTQIWSLIFVDVWKTTPFMALLLLAGLQTIPSDIYEAADVDGAGRIRQFFSMTLPMLRPTIAIALVFRTLDAIRAFDVFDVLVGRQLQSIATYNQFVLVNEQEFGYASAVGVTIFVIILIFTIIYVKSLGVEAE
jgi:trehalose/maltose transport system permease protein